ncbi:hypothetical protein POM88_016819 [Heracleum sosnowskyi]|uniref:Uncharacterized protein n=1 Tax=Heracleum sosnowskyi TaxID=360622 RepID=A0AAD8IND1_9APIA|nr:hypothetical protein POM88_016819 [Heracleum sosnowskyi]
MLPAPWTTTILFKTPFVADYELDFPVVPLIDYTSVGLSTISQSLNGASILYIKKTTTEDDLLLNVASGSTTFNKIEATVSSDPLNLRFYTASNGYLVTEVIQFTRKFGQWQENGETEGPAEDELYDYDVLMDV